MKHFFYHVLEKIIRDAVIEAFPEVTVRSPLLEMPKDESLGDFSSSVSLKIASTVKQPPLAIAERIKDTILKKTHKNIRSIEIVKPGFLNVYLTDDCLKETAAVIFAQKDFFHHIVEEKEKILLEFVSANPTGPLSIAHGRQAIIGDVIARIFTFCGVPLTRQYYINDEGRQIDLLVQSFQERVKQSQGQSHAIPEDGYQGEYLLDIAAKYVKENSSEDHRTYTLKAMLGHIKDELQLAGVGFDVWTSQKKLREDGLIDQVIGVLRNKGYIFEEDDAVWFKSTLFGDDKDRVLIKKDGSYTYFAADIAFHYFKIEQGYNRLVNLWGPDHHGYIPRMKAALQALGFSKDHLDIIIIQLVTLKNKEKMSKRKGNIILLSDLIEDVGRDAARFYYITRKNSSHLDFDIQMAKTSSFDNPLYYIQYAHARISSVIRKAEETLGTHAVDMHSLKFLKEKEEIDVLRAVCYFPVFLLLIMQSLEPFFIPEYLKKLANLFHRFYEKHTVLSDNKETTQARLALISIVRHVLASGLSTLGITAPERM